MLTGITYSAVATSFLLAVFIGSASHKFIDLARFRASLAAYALLPKWAVPVFTIVFPGAELLGALMLLDGATRTIGLASLFGLSVVYFGAICINLIQGHTGINCGCHFYDVAEEFSSLSFWHALRPAFLAATALSALPLADFDLSLGKWAIAVCSILPFYILYIGVDVLMMNSAFLRTIKNKGQ